MTFVILYISSCGPMFVATGGLKTLAIDTLLSPLERPLLSFIFLRDGFQVCPLSSAFLSLILLFYPICSTGYVGFYVKTIGGSLFMQLSLRRDMGIPVCHPKVGLIQFWWHVTLDTKHRKVDQVVRSTDVTKASFVQSVPMLIWGVAPKM